MLRVKPPTGQELARLRDDFSLTQEEAAAQVGVSKRTWQNWEAGGNPRAKHRRALQAWLESRKDAA